MPASLDDVLHLLYVFAGERWPLRKLEEVQLVLDDGAVKRFSLPDYETIKRLEQRERGSGGGRPAK